MKTNIKKYISQENEKTNRNQIIAQKGINTWAVSLVRYSGPFLKWMREELHQINQRKRKLMTIYKA